MTRLGARSAVPIAFLALSLAIGVAAWLRFHDAGTSGCPTTYSPDIWPTGGLAAVVGAFLLGGLLGTVAHNKAGQGYGLLTQIGLFVFVASIALIWGYETFALASESTSTPPLTFFVMCARFNENDWTLFVFILAALVTGRWLWHRTGANMP